MNRLLVITIVFMIGIFDTNHLSAQGLIDTGWKLGINYATYGGEDAPHTNTNKVLSRRYMLGMYLEYRLNDHLTLRPEINYSMKGVRYDRSDDGDVDVEGTNLNYLEIPILWLMLSDARAFVHTGPYVGMYLDGEKYFKRSRSGGTSSHSRGIDTWGINRIDIGYILGLSYPLTDNLKIEARFALGLRSLDNLEDSSVMNNVFQFMVHYSQM